MFRTESLKFAHYGERAPFWRRRVRILGRGISLGWLLVACVTVAALAWGAYAIWLGTSSLHVSVKEAPAEPNVSLNGELCAIVAGAGAVDSCVLSGKTLTGTYSVVDDTTTLKQIVNMSNSSDSPVCLSITYDDAPEWAETVIGSLPKTVNPGSPSSDFGLQLVAEPAAMLAAAGTTLAPLDINIQAEEGACP